MIEELNDAAEFLRSVDHELTDVSVAWLLQQGPSLEVIEAEMETHIRRAGSKQP
jgi:hypothetical protein